MTPRRTLLLIMLLALAGCAAAGMLALVVKSNESVWKLMGTCFATAVATGLLMPLSLLADRPNQRAGGVSGMVVVVACWLMIMAIIWSEILGGELIAWRDFYVLGQTSLVGFPTVAILLLIKLPWARVAVYTFVSVAAMSYGCFVFGSILPPGTSFAFGTSPHTEHLWGTGLAMLGFGFLASLLLVNIGCGDKRYFRWPGEAIIAAGLMIAIPCIWLDINDNIFGRIIALTAISGIVLAHANLVLMARLKASQRWLQVATLTFAAASGISVAIAIILDFDDGAFEDSMYFRVSTAFAIAAASGSLALIVLSMFNRKTAPVPVFATEYKEITLICPSCSTRQALPLGTAACKVCSLEIQIKVIEPRCPACSYLLYNIQSDRCPECGAPIRNPPPAPDLPAAPTPTIPAV